MMKPLFIIIQMLCCIPLAGQTIHGLVVNPDKKAIPYANVVLVTKADSSYIAGPSRRKTESSRWRTRVKAFR